MLISRDNPPKIPSLKIESKNSQHKSSAHSNILQLVPICNAQMTCLSIGFYFYIGLKGYLLATLHELLKFTKTWNHFKLHMYNSVSTQFNRGMKMNRTGRTQHLYSFLLLCNKDPSPKKIDIYYFTVSIGQDFGHSRAGSSVQDVIRLQLRCQLDKVLIWSLGCFSELIQIVEKCVSWWLHD